MEVLGIVLAVIVVSGVSWAIGRAVGGAWLALFSVLMIGIGALLVLSMLNSTGEFAGLFEILILLFVWAPVFVCGGIGAAIGWIWRKQTD